MTLRYDDLPIDGDGAHAESMTPEWLQAHPPLVTVQVWLGPGNAVMSQVTWHKSIYAEDEAVLKPLEEMLVATVALHSTVHRLEQGLAAAIQLRHALLALPSAGVGGN